jgi:serine protease Do
MFRLRFLAVPLAALVLCLSASQVRAQKSFAAVSEEVNKKVVKLFGAGGIRGLPSYGSGIVVSADGYILTINSHILATEDLRVHLSDGRRYHAKVVCSEPVLDVALIKIDPGKEKIDLPFFDPMEAAKRKPAEAGTSVLAFSNQFLIGTRGEPMSVQRGLIESYCKLEAKRGIFEAPYAGDVYVVDAIMNNPGAAGGALTTRKGELLGVIGKELRNDRSNTWMNYAVPISAKIEVRDETDKLVSRSILELIEKKEKYNPVKINLDKKRGGGYTGIVLVHNVLEFTPPYVEQVDPGSPAAKAGLKADDLIVYMDGLPINNIQGYEEQLEKYRPGEEIRLEIQRSKKLITATIKIEEHKKKPKPIKKDDEDK